MKIDMLIVGGDGDLALRKLYPALYYLELNGCMPEDTMVVGTARTPHEHEEFLATVHSWLRENVPERNYDEAVWQSFSKRVRFQQADATKPDDLQRVKEECLHEDRQLVVYLAVPPKIFGPVCTSLEACGLVRPSTRLVVEKPLGDSKEAFIAINEELSRVFTEEQLYRIDHYLGKESVQNLIALRFANDIFEPLWNSKYIDHIQITVTETVGTGNRWDFYNDTGATRDMVQNHLLQVLCLVAMEPPPTMNADFVRGEKLKILRSLKPITVDDVEKLTVRGQYEAGVVNGEEVPGYLNETGEPRESDTETYVALKAEIMNWRWSGTPIYIRTGKRLNRRHSEIVIQFKQNNHQVFGEQTLQVPNQLIIHLQPDEGIRLRVMNKRAGLDDSMSLEDRFLDLSFSDNAKSKKHDAYTRVLHDVFRNDQTLFVSAAEVEAAWEWVDKIFAGWRQKSVQPAGYAAGSTGPIESIEFMARDGRRWHSN